MESSWMWSQKPSGLEQPWSNWPKRKAQVNKMERFVTSLDATSLSLKFRLSYLTAAAGNIQFDINTLYVLRKSSPWSQKAVICAQKKATTTCWQNPTLNKSFDNQNLIFSEKPKWGFFNPGSSFETKARDLRHVAPSASGVRGTPERKRSSWKKPLFWLGGDCLLYKPAIFFGKGMTICDGDSLLI